MMKKTFIAALLFGSCLETSALAEPTCKASPTSIQLSGVDEVFPEIEQKLRKGLAVNMQHEAYIGTKLVARFGCKLYFDLWDETYGVTPLGQNKERRVKNKAAVQDLCFSWTGSPINLETSKDALKVLVHIDPISDEQAKKTREWLAERGIASNSSGQVFGRAVSAMINLKQEKSLTLPCSLGSKAGGQP